MAMVVLVVSCKDKEPETNGKKVVKFKIAHGVNKNSHLHTGCEYFARLLRERSNGVLQPTVYTSGELGQSRSLLEGLQLGTVQIILTAAAPLSAFDSKLMLCDMPFLFDSHEQVRRFLDGEFGRQIVADLPKKARMRVLAQWESGFRSVFSTKGPIHTLEDIKELKIRVMETPVHIDAFKALGAIPAPMSFGELYTSLAQRVVDAAENDADALWTQGFWEVCKYFSLTNHAYTAIPLVISEQFYQKLTPQQQAIVQQAANDARDYERNVARQRNEKALKELEKAGVKINTVDPTEFRKAMASIYKKYEKIIGADLMKAALDAQ